MDILTFSWTTIEIYKRTFFSCKLYYGREHKHNQDLKRKKSQENCGALFIDIFVFKWSK